MKSVAYQVSLVENVQTVPALPLLVDERLVQLLPYTDAAAGDMELLSSLLDEASDNGRQSPGKAFTDVVEVGRFVINLVRQDFVVVGEYGCRCVGGCVCVCVCVW